MNLVDTSGWIEYFFEGNNASYFSEAIEHTVDLIVPVVCLYEVFKKVNQVADEARALQAVAQMKQGEVIELSEEIALRAALISLKHKLTNGDSFGISGAHFNSKIPIFPQIPLQLVLRNYLHNLTSHKGYLLCGFGLLFIMSCCDLQLKIAIFDWSLRG